MKKRTSTDTAIEELVAASCTGTMTLREAHIYREALRGLVRLAKSEQTLEMKTQLNRLTAGVAARAARRHARTILPAQRLGAIPKDAQQQLEVTKT
jgi:hypothetical protein